MEALEEVAEEYRWLLQPNIENLQVNKIYALPREELGFVPKHNNFAHDFLLTSQRLQILKTVSGSMGKKAPGGFIFAGAHGTGKSTLGLLLASFAWANKYGLIFISGAEIRSKGYGALLQNYLSHNTRNRARWPEFLQEALLYNPGQYPNSLIEDFNAFLWKVPEARLIIVDEHNELWRGPVTSEHLIARHWEHSLFGPRAFTIFIGSAHSKFLQNLPDGYDRFVVHVDPWTWEEFTCISTSFPTINAALSCSLSRDQVESITGLLPRLLHGLENELRSGGSAKTFEAHQARLWRSRLDKLHRSERLIAGIRAVLQLIPGHGDVLGPAALIFDLGLVKLDKQARQWIPLCNLAKLVMVDYVLSNTLKSSQGGYILERALEAWHGKSQIRVLCLGNEQVFYEHDIQSFARIVQHFAVEPQATTMLQSAGSVLFWPREGFQLQYVDWIVVNHHARTVDFCALSKTFLSQKLAKRQLQAGRRRNHFTNWMDLLTGSSGHKLASSPMDKELSPQEKKAHSPKLDKGKLPPYKVPDPFVFTSNPSNYKLRWFFFAIPTGSDLLEMKQYEKDAKECAIQLPDGVYVVSCSDVITALSTPATEAGL